MIPVTARLGELRVYVSHVVALFFPGAEVLLFDAYPFQGMGATSRWSAADLDTLLDEGRRQLDNQATRHEAIRDTAKTLLTVALAVIAFAASFFARTTSRHEWWLLSLWLLAVAMVGASALGAGAMLATRAAFGTIDINLLTAAAGLPPTSTRTKSDLCGEYLKSMKAGEDTLATRLSVIRTAVTLLLLGVALLLVTWLLARRSA